MDIHGSQKTRMVLEAVEAFIPTSMFQPYIPRDAHREGREGTLCFIEAVKGFEQPDEGLLGPIGGLIADTPLSKISKQSGSQVLDVEIPFSRLHGGNCRTESISLQKNSKIFAGGRGAHRKAWRTCFVQVTKQVFTKKRRNCYYIPEWNIEISL